MRFLHNIQYKDGEIWKKWVAENIGIKGVDYFQEIETVVEKFEGGGCMEYRQGYWVIPDPKKAMLWALRWS